MSTLIFLWLHNQNFYKNLQKSVVDSIALNNVSKNWADIGCSTGLMTRLAYRLDYNVIGYDINSFSLILAKLLSWGLKNIKYEKKDFHTLEKKFDIVTATSLLSVVDDKKASLVKLISLLKDEHSSLIIIEPTEQLRVKNVKKLIYNFRTFWFYKGLLLWAKARENKEIDKKLFEEINNIKVVEKYYLDGMVCVFYVQKSFL